MDLLSPIPDAVTVDFSTRCNLRCTYCSTGGSEHTDIDMRADVLANIEDFCKRQRISRVWLSASGETTMLAGWQHALARFLDQYENYSLHINSNFARPYSVDDLDALNKFVAIQVSIDSSSPELMKKQRTADLRTIVYNVVRLRQKMIQTGRPTAIEFSCVLTRDNASHVDGLATLALLLGATKLNIIEGSAVSSGGNPRMPDTLDRMSEEEGVACAESVFKASAALRGTPTKFQVSGGLLGKLLPALTALAKGERPVNVMANFQSATRQSAIGPCLQPWSTVIVKADGDVPACCGTNFVFGNANERSVTEIFDGAEAREFRSMILAGGPDLPCATCPVASSQTAPEFEAELRLHKTRYAALEAAYDSTAAAAAEPA